MAAEGRWLGAEAPVDRELARRRFLDDLASPRHAVRLVAESGGVVIGQVRLVLEPWGVADLSMFVADGWRGRGVGGALVAAAVERARSGGAHKVALQVWPHNAAAVALYERVGFEVEGRLRRHWRRRNGALWDALVMGLALDHDAPGGPAA